MVTAMNARGILFSLLLYFSSLFGTLLFLLPCLPFALKWPSLGRRMMDLFLWLWYLLAVAAYEILLGVKVIIHGNPAPASASTLILCNHRTRLDWLFLMSYQLRCGSLSHYRISLKASLKSIPGPGWAMQCAAFLFMWRNWSKDKEQITRALRYFALSCTQPQVDSFLEPVFEVIHEHLTEQFLLFPEGTDYCTNGLQKSKVFAETNGFPVYEHVLHPRTTGFVHFMNMMTKYKILDSVVDVTVAYPKTVVHSEAELGMGKSPQEVHFCVQHFPAKDLPQSTEKLEEWCRQLWLEKETTLGKFYEAKTFAVNGEKPVASVEKERRVRIQLWAVMAFWSTFLLGVCYALLFFPLFKWYCILSAATYVFIDKQYGGVDSLLYAVFD